MQRSEEEVQRQHYRDLDNALDSLITGLKPFVEHELQNKYGLNWEDRVSRMPGRKPNLNDPSALLGTMLSQWWDVFQDSLGHKGKNLVGELKEWRNAPAHRDQLNHEDVIRSLDSMSRLLELVVPIHKTEKVVTSLQELKSRKLELELQRLEHLISPKKEQAALVSKPVMVQRERPAVTPSETEEAEIGDSVLLLRIDRSYRFGMTAEELYEATRGDWAITPKKRSIKPRYAMAVVSFIIREVYEIDDWHPVPMSSWGPGRWRFDGIVALDQSNFIGKSVQSYINRRSSNPAKYVNC
jgi:hypothetical protein